MYLCIMHIPHIRLSSTHTLLFKGWKIDFPLSCRDQVYLQYVPSAGVTERCGLVVPETIWIFFLVRRCLATLSAASIKKLLISRKKFLYFSEILLFLAATKQLYKWYFPSLSVCLPVCLSVTLFWLCSHHRIIMKFWGVITSDQSKVHAKGQGQRSKVKVTEVTTQLNRFRTVTPVWIHIWWWNDAYSLMLLRRGALLFFKVICQISRSQGSKNRWIWPRLGVSGL